MNLALLFKTALAASWQGSLVIAVILLLRPLLGLRVPAQWRSLLWMLALIRLLVPAFLLPPSPASFENIPAVQHSVAQTQRALAPGGPAAVTDQGPDAGDLANFAVTPAEPDPSGISGWEIAALVWLAGASTLALLSIGATVRLRRRIQKDAQPLHPAAIQAWERCRQELALPRAPQLVATSAVDSPALLGVFRPLLLIPSSAQYSREDWQNVFLHELAHFRRRDHWAQAVQLAALCVHWFNPLVWIGFRQLRSDRELAADEWALRHLDDSRTVSYGDTLLKILDAQSRPAWPTAIVGIGEDAAQLKQRLQRIANFTPKKVFGSVVGAATLLMLGAVVVGRQLDPPDLSHYAGLSPAEILVTAAGSGDAPVVEKMLADGAMIDQPASVRGPSTALTAAIASNQLEVARWLIEHGADLNFAPKNGAPPIVVALKSGWEGAVQLLLREGAATDPALLAAAAGNIEAVDRFLAAGKTDFDKLELLNRIAAVHGHAELFAKLWDTIRELPGQENWEPPRGTVGVSIARGHREVVEEMLERGEPLNKSGVMRLAPLVAGSPDLRAWLEEKGFAIPAYNLGEQLIDATERENLPEMRRLIQAGAGVNYRGESDWTPVSKAATWGNPRAVKLLLDHHADPKPSKHGYNALELAKTPEIADMLVAAGARIESEDIRYRVTHGSVESVRWFIDHGVDPLEIKDPNSGSTLLFDAGDPEIARLLIARGIDVNARDKRGRTALVEILQRRSQAAEIAQVLLENGADPNERFDDGSTPLMIARDGASIDVLVAAGADIHAGTDHGNGVLYSGWGAGIPSRDQALLRHGLELDPVEGGKLLINAILLRGDLPAVKSLLALGVDPNAGGTSEGRRTCSALSAALSNGHFEIAEVLREAGANEIGLLSESAAKGNAAQMTALLDADANVNEADRAGQTPLFFAILRGQIDAVHLLLNRGANVNHFDEAGMTAHSYTNLLIRQIEDNHFTQLPGNDLAAARQTLDGIMAAILAHHPDPTYRNEAGETALMRAAQIGNSLPLAGKDGKNPALNLQRPDGMTALMLAIVTQPKDAPLDGPGSVATLQKDGSVNRRFSRRGSLVEILLAMGADATLRNHAGQTARDLARANGNAEIIEILEKHKP